MKRALTVTPGHADFKDVVKLSWETLAKPGFREDVDRVGGVTGG